MEKTKPKNIFKNRKSPLYAYSERFGCPVELALVWLKLCEDVYFYKVKPVYEDDDKSFWVAENQIYNLKDMLKKFYNVDYQP